MNYFFFQKKFIFAELYKKITKNMYNFPLSFLANNFRPLLATFFHSREPAVGIYGRLYF